MRKTIVKKPRKANIKQAVESVASKPIKTGLKKTDPNYYSKIGIISAKKRNLPTSFFSDMARKSHKHRTEYRGGRKKKEVQELDNLKNELKAATKK